MNRQNEIYHHGILGQKWGIRRYQNPDGTLTKAGRKRYGNLIENRNDAVKFKYYARMAKEDGDKDLSKDYHELEKLYSSTFEKKLSEMNKSPIGKRYVDEILRNAPLSKDGFYRPWEVERESKLGDNAQNSIKKNSSNISKQVTKEMLKDLERWQKEGNSKTKISPERATAIEKQIKKNIENSTSQQQSGNKISFVINTVKEYSDSAPLTVEYDINKNKLIDMYYT